ncbi:retrovirus-related pol polyprotein from transposon TNT 1-94 [Tanacetum coccineum]|uniref:Retrovirus-related pol polyprotein from transposon TNT 1-94 n=1 Tax=Tanacetum coccineum TaxID=301880 RepID=A0ABQ5CIR5_9ASTR
MFKDLKKFQAKLDRYHDMNYASKVEVNCVKTKGDLMSYKMESQKLFNEYTRNINDLNQIISEIKKELTAHQETISIISQEKEAQKKFHKTREDKELEKSLLWKIKLSFVKPEFLKKAQRANPRLYDIGCYNDNLALMLAPESDETIRLAQESRSKLRVIPTTSVSRPQLKSNRLEDRVMHNNSQGKKQQVEEHHRNFKFSNNKMSVTACNDSLNAKPSNKTVASDSTNQKPRSKIRKQYEHVSKTCRWWYSKITPPGYQWKPKSSAMNVKPNVSLPLGNKSRNANTLEPMKLRKSTLSNTPLSFNSFVAHRYNTDHCRLWVLKAHDEKSQASKSGSRKYHYQNVVLRKSACYIHDSKGNDLLTGSYGTYLYSITLQDTSTPNPICLMAKASSLQAWLWHHRLSHLNFDTINFLSKYDIVTGLPKLKFVKDHLCSSCELGKAKHKSFKTKTTPSSKRRLQILYMDLCGPMRVESFNGKKYVMVIVNDYLRYTWTHFLRSKDETPEVLIDFLKLVQRGLHAQDRTFRTDKGMEFLNKTLHAYFAQEGIEHQTSTARTPEQNG